MVVTRAMLEDRFKSKAKHKPIYLQMTFVLPALLFLLVIIMALFAPLLAPYDPIQPAPADRLMPPFFTEGGSTGHLLGTDSLGRDILSRVIYGTRISLSVAVLVILITSSVGTVLGIISGYIGGRVDAFLMRVTDVSLSFPPILIAILLAAAIGPSFWTVVGALSLLGWAPYARLIRGEALKIREEDFVTQARIIGASPLRIMTRHIFPNIINPLIIIMTLSVGMVILTEAVLSFLGVGIPPPTATWGNMVNDGRSYLSNAWWISTFPGIAIGLVVLAGNFLGDWIRDKLDPKLRQI